MFELKPQLELSCYLLKDLCQEKYHRPGVLTIYMEKLEIPVGKSNFSELGKF